MQGLSPVTPAELLMENDTFSSTLREQLYRYTGIPLSEMTSSYHWQELAQVSFLSKQKFCRNKHVFVMTNACLSLQNMSFVTTKVCLLWQKNCRDKILFVATKLLSWQIFVTTNTCLLRQKFCHGKHTSVVTVDVFCHDKHKFVMTKVSLSWQKFCRDKHTFVVTKATFCRDKNDTCGSSRQGYPHPTQ